MGALQIEKHTPMSKRALRLFGSSNLSMLAFFRRLLCFANHQGRGQLTWFKNGSSTAFDCPRCFFFSFRFDIFLPTRSSTFGVLQVTRSVHGRLAHASWPRSKVLEHLPQRSCSLQGAAKAAGAAVPQPWGDISAGATA